ncbi:3'-5' exonuclease [Methylobacterium planeticum]|uniref:3'-5' exonuclease n=1 Tax=Methylobacterium planeticum TaxID=2615211 RepID=UPI001243AAC2|nr:3'-5' exonuclease [Methylobacterium planeticum]
MFDLETVPDLAALARAHGLAASDEAGAEALLKGKFPKLVFHKIVCIGMLVAERREGIWRVRSLDAPHAGHRSEADLITDFAAEIEALRPQLVTFNGTAFDLPVLRYRALVHRLPVPGLTCRPYYQRYSEAALDLCDMLAGFLPGGKVSLDSLSRALDLPGKPEGIDGSRVHDFVRAGRLDEVSAYCRADVAATYRIWLALKRVRGEISEAAYRASEADLAQRGGETHLQPAPVLLASATMPA